MSIEFDIKNFIRKLTTKPGVYRMINASNDIIYVGKAKNLRNRVRSYFQNQDLSSKTRALVAQIARIEVTVTFSEQEALLLENNLIKEFRPRYNVLFRDDKSYPYLHLSQHNYPRLGVYRGKHYDKGQYFGPYPNVHAVRETLNLLQKLFRVRSCSDTFFNARSRPCLLHQIKRCTAPCVKLITEPDYNQDIAALKLFLRGRKDELTAKLSRQMEQAAEDLAFEQAAHFRDQITHLRHVQAEQVVASGSANADAIVALNSEDGTCVQWLMIRAGRLIGSQNFFPLHAQEVDLPEIVSAFITHHYLGNHEGNLIPPLIVTNVAPLDLAWLQASLCEIAKHKVSIVTKVRGERAQWLALAKQNAEHALQQHRAERTTLEKRFTALQKALHLAEKPTRIECFDVSHSSGEATVASCVVFDTTGSVKNDYRRFNITNIAPGDDYGALKQALLRRYTRLKATEAKLPDLLLIDGGKGQLEQARLMVAELQLTDITVVAVAKGPSRKPGLEVLHRLDGTHPFMLAADSPALHLIQQIRDEAHRFAITSHRKRRAKTRQTSILEGISGIGAKRRRLLLQHFGGLQALSAASVTDIAKTPGMSQRFAEKIYQFLHQT